MLVIQHDHLRLVGQAGFADLQSGLALVVAVQAHFLQELIQRVERHLRAFGRVVHRDDDIRLQQADDLRRLGRVQATAAAHRDQDDIHRPQGLDFSLGRHLTQIAHVRHRQAVVIENVQSIARLLAGLLAAPVRLYTGNENAADLEFARPGNRVGISLYCVEIIVAGCIVADRDDIRLEFERFIAHRLGVERIGHHRRQVSLSQAEARMSVPGNFHVATSGAIIPVTYEVG